MKFPKPKKLLKRKNEKSIKVLIIGNFIKLLFAKLLDNPAVIEEKMRE
jgi:hypothetical protein